MEILTRTITQLTPEIWRFKVQLPAFSKKDLNS